MLIIHQLIFEHNFLNKFDIDFLIMMFRIIFIKLNIIKNNMVICRIYNYYLNKH